MSMCELWKYVDFDIYFIVYYVYICIECNVYRIFEAGLHKYQWPMSILNWFFCLCDIFFVFPAALKVNIICASGPKTNRWCKDTRWIVSVELWISAVVPDMERNGLDSVLTVIWIN